MQKYWYVLVFIGHSVTEGHLLIVHCPEGTELVEVAWCAFSPCVSQADNEARPLLFSVPFVPPFSVFHFPQ